MVGNKTPMAAKLFIIFTFTFLFYYGSLSLISHIGRIPLSRVRLPFIFGCLSPLLLLAIRIIGNDIIQMSHILGLSIFFFAFLEECVKSMYFPFFHRKNKKSIYQMGSIGLGFSCIENILYFMTFSVIIPQHQFLIFCAIRLVIDSTAHFLFTAFTARFFLQKQLRRGLTWSVSAHTLFNYLLTIQWSILIVPLFYILVKHLRARST